MFVVVAELTVNPSDHDKFLPHVLENARLTRTTEAGCRQFDTHQASTHLKAFREAAGSMLKTRDVRFFQRLAP